MTATRVLIWSATHLHCQGLAMLLGDGAFAVRTTTSWDESEIRDAGEGSVDVVLVDLAAPQSHEAIGALATSAPGAPIVALSVPQDEGAVVECAKAGVTAFLSREATVEDLRRTVVLAGRGESPGPSWLMPMLLRRVAADAGHDGSAAAAALDRLTHREQEVLALLAHGLSNKQIARELHIELPTVKSHVHSILQKLEVSRRDEASARLHAVHSDVGS